MSSPSAKNRGFQLMSRLPSAPCFAKVNNSLSRLVRFDPEVFPLMYRIRPIVHMAVFVALVSLVSTEAPAKDSDPRMPLIIYPLNSGGGVKQETASALSTLLAFELSKSGKFRLVEESEITKVLEQQKMSSLNECTSPQCRIRLGHLLRARKFAAGDVLKLADTYIVTIKVVDIESGETEYLDKMDCRCPADSLQDIIAVLANRIRLNYGEKVKPLTADQVRKTPELKPVVFSAKYMGGYVGEEDKKRGELVITGKEIIFRKNEKKEHFRIPLSQINKVSVNEEVKDSAAARVFVWVFPDKLADKMAQREIELVAVEYRNEMDKVAGCPVFELKKNQSMAVKNVIETRAHIRER